MPGTCALAMTSRIALLWTALQAIGSCMTGLALLCGGQARFSGPSFDVARVLLPLSCWGALFLLSGALMLGAALTRQRCVLWAALPPAVMYAIFAGSIAFATDHALVPYTGPSTYAGMAVLTTVAGCVGRWVFSLQAQR